MFYYCVYLMQVISETVVHTKLDIYLFIHVDFRACAFDILNYSLILVFHIAYSILQLFDHSISGIMSIVFL